MKFVLDALTGEWQDAELVLAKTSERSVTGHLRNCFSMKMIESTQDGETILVRLSAFGRVMRDTVQGFPERPGGRYRE